MRLPSLDDLYSELNIVDTAISPSGRYLAIIVRRPTDDTLAVLDELHLCDPKVLDPVIYAFANSHGKKPRQCACQSEADKTLARA